MPGPPTPITWTRRGCDRSSGATGTLVEGVEATITTDKGYGWTRGAEGDAATATLVYRSLEWQGDGFHQLSECATPVHQPEL